MTDNQSGLTAELADRRVAVAAVVRVLIRADLERRLAEREQGR